MRGGSKIIFYEDFVSEQQFREYDQGGKYVCKIKNYKKTMSDVKCDGVI